MATSLRWRTHTAWTKIKANSARLSLKKLTELLNLYSYTKCLYVLTTWCLPT